MGSGGISIWQILIILLLIPIVLLPSIIAVKKNHVHKIAIILVNIFGGLIFGIGWVVALIWCFYQPAVQPVTIVSTSIELEELHGLKEMGAISQEEYNSVKKRLLEAISNNK